MGSLAKPTKLPLRIAILECDTLSRKITEQFGGYGGLFKQLLDLSADALGYPGLSSAEGLELTYYNVEKDEENYPRVDDIDAILITGSRHAAFDNISWIIRLVEFTKEILQQDRVRVIGVCFGHQIVGRALGQRVDRGESGWEVSVVPVDLSEKGKQLMGVSAGPLKIYQMHRDIVYGFPKGVEALGSSTVCPNQGMYEKGMLLTVQGHPEFTKDIVDEIVRKTHSRGVFSAGVYEDALKRLEDHDDGVIVGQAFLRFLLED